MDEMTLAQDLPQLDASTLVDGERVEREVKDMYRHVAHGDVADLHFEVGRSVAERLGYPAPLLDAIPAEARGSFEPGGTDPGLAGILELDAMVTVELTAPTLWDPLPLRGKVAWLRRGAAGKPARAGIRFEHHDAGALFALYEVLASAGFDV